MRFFLLCLLDTEQVLEEFLAAKTEYNFFCLVKGLLLFTEDDLTTPNDLTQMAKDKVSSAGPERLRERSRRPAAPLGLTEGPELARCGQGQWLQRNDKQAGRVPDPYMLVLEHPGLLQISGCNAVKC